MSMSVGVKGAYDCIKAFSETDLTEDLEKFDIPTLIVHGDDDQIVPIGAAALESSKIVKDSTLKVYPGTPHGLAQTPAPAKAPSTPTCSASSRPDLKLPGGGAAWLAPGTVRTWPLEEGIIMTDANSASGPVTVVLVHGAFADGSGWSGVIERLQAANVPVPAPATAGEPGGD